MKPFLSFIFATFIIMFFISCNSVPDPKEDGMKKINDIIIHKTYYEKSGALKSEITIKDKKKNGPAKKYYTTGEVNTVVNYVNNIKEGETIWYYKNGQPYRVTQYVNGKIEGIRKIYYENGKIKAEIPYKNGKFIGGTKEYNVNGALLTSYPKIVFETQNEIFINNTFILICRLNNNSKNVRFFQEIPDSNNNTSQNELKITNGVSKIEFHIPPSVIIDKQIVIYAHIKTSMGNPYIVKKIYNLKINTN